MSPASAMRFQSSLTDAIVARFGRADEVVRRAAEIGVHLLEELRHLVDKLARRLALLRGRLLDFLAVLVGAGQEQHVIAVEPLEAG